MKLNELVKMYLSRRAVVFGATGLVNSLTMVPLLAGFAIIMPHLYATWIVVQLSIFTDYIWKNYLVFRGVKATRSKWHFEWTALTGVLVQDVVVWALAGRMEYLLLYLFSVFLGFIARYGLTKTVIWSEA